MRKIFKFLNPNICTVFYATLVTQKNDALFFSRYQTQTKKNDFPISITLYMTNYQLLEQGKTLGNANPSNQVENDKETENLIEILSLAS